MRVSVGRVFFKPFPNPSHPSQMTEQTPKPKKSMREAMPNVAAWVDQMRALIGDDEMNDAIKRGMRGEPVFFAQENGHSVGTEPAPGEAVKIDLSEGFHGAPIHTAANRPRRK